MALCDKRRVCWISSVSLGILNLIAFGVLSWIIVPMFYSDDVVQQLRFLYGETGAGEHWRKFSIPSYQWLSPTLLHVYLFNVSNPSDIVRNGVKPILKQVGPYIYTVDKSAVSRSTDNITTEFQELTVYHFSPLLTPQGLRESDLVTVLNVPYLEIIGQMTSVPSQNRLLTSLLAAGTDGDSQVFVTKPVRKILFEGFSQSSTGAINKLRGSTSPKQSETSYIYPRNGSLSPPYKVYAATPATATAPAPVGVKFGDIQEYDSEQEMQHWADSYGGRCNKISGTVDGMMFEPVSRTDDVIHVFHPEICRTLKFAATGTQQVSDDSPIKGFDFQLSTDQLYESTVNFANNCYCPREGVALPGGCIQPGVLSNCRNEGFPFVTTLPHFFAAEQLPLARSVVGLEPTASSHQSIISVEPITGLATKSVTRLQTNYQLKPLTSQEDTRSLPDILMPILWTQETKEMNAVFKTIIQDNIYTNLFYLSIGIYISLALGISLLAFGFCLYCIRERKSSSSRQASRAAADKEGSKRNGQPTEVDDVRSNGDKAAGVPLLTLNGKDSLFQIVSPSEAAAAPSTSSSSRGTVL